MFLGFTLVSTVINGLETEIPSFSYDSDIRLTDDFPMKEFPTMNQSYKMWQDEKSREGWSSNGETYYGIPPIPSGLNMSYQDLRKVDLSALGLRYSHLDHSNFEDKEMVGLDLIAATLRYANLRGVDLSNSHLIETNLTNSDLAGATLAGATMWDATLSHTRVTNSLLTNTDLSGANLSFANLSGAKLPGAILYESRCEFTDFTNADLTGASLEHAEISNAIFKNTKMPDGTIRN